MGLSETLVAGGTLTANKTEKAEGDLRGRYSEISSETVMVMARILEEARN